MQALNTAYAAVLDRTCSYVGIEHMRSLYRIIGRNNLPLVVDECVTSLDLKIRTVLSPYVMELFGAMPPSSKLPRADYGTQGVLGLFHSKLLDISTYPPLQSDVYQHLKEMGNAIAFLNMLDYAAVRLVGTHPSRREWLSHSCATATCRNRSSSSKRYSRHRSPD